MFDLINKSLEAAIGALSVTQDKLKEIADELVLKGHLSKKEGEDLLSSLKTTADESRKNLSSFIEEQIRKAIKDMGIATSAEIKALEGKIAKLEAKIEASAGKPAAKKTASK